MPEPRSHELCAANGCQLPASIIHGGKPLCGRHALERLEWEMAAGKRLPLKE